MLISPLIKKTLQLLKNQVNNQNRWELPIFRRIQTKSLVWRTGMQPMRELPKSRKVVPSAFGIGEQSDNHHISRARNSVQFMR